MEENVHESQMVSLAHDLGTSQCRVASHALAGLSGGRCIKVKGKTTGPPAEESEPSIQASQKCYHQREVLERVCHSI